MDESPSACIEVAYASPERTVVKVYRLRLPATVADAILRAGADPDFAGLQINAAPLGVFGVRALPEQILTEGDRVEIYRPLLHDPKNARRVRAAGRRRKSQ